MVERQTNEASRTSRAVTAADCVGLAKELRAGGKAREAELAYLEALAREPHAVAAWTGLLALCTDEFEDLVSAEVCNLEALRSTSEPATYLASYGRFLLERRRFHEAEGVLERSVAISPDLASAWCDLGAARLGLGKPREAVADFMRGMELAPGIARSYAGLGSCFVMLGNRAAAAEAFGQALALDPLCYEALLGLARIREERGAFDDAEALLRKALGERTADLEANAALARVLSARGALAEAKEYYGRAAEAGGGVAMVLQGLLAAPGDPAAEHRDALRNDMRDRLERFLQAEIEPEAESALACGGFAPAQLAFLSLDDEQLARLAVRAYRKLCPLLGYVASHAMQQARGCGPTRIAFVARFAEAPGQDPAFLELIAAAAARPGVEVAMVNLGLAEQGPAITALAARCARTIAVADDSLPGARQAIAALQADVVVHADLAATQLAWFLAFMRLARFQCVWSASAGTAGLDSIDLCLDRRRAHDLVAMLVEAASSMPPALPDVVVSLIGLADACASQGTDYHMLHPPEYGCVVEPQLLGAAVAAPVSERIVRFPPLAAGELRDVEVQGGESATFVRPLRRVVHMLGEHLSFDRVAFESRWIAAAVNRQYLLNPRRAKLSLDKAIVLLGEASGNYYHWMLDNMPRLQCFADDCAYDDWPILVDAGLHPNLLAALHRVVGRNRRLIEIAAGERVRVAHALVLSGGTAIPIDPREGRRLEPQDVLISPAAVQFLRDRLGAGSAVSPAVRRRIYLSRKGRYWRLLNAEEVEAAFRGAGFEIVYPETLGLDEQIALFSEADVIAGPTGAAFTNVLFAPKGAKVIVFHVDGGIHYYFSNLAAAAGLKTTYVFGTPLPDTHKKAHQIDYFVPLRLIEEALARVCSQLAQQPSAPGAGSMA